MSFSTLWISCEVVVSFCTIVDAYILSCLISFYIRRSSANASKRSVNRLSKDNTRVIEDDREQRHQMSTTGTKVSTKKHRLRKLMLVTAILVSSIALIKLLVDQAKFFYVWQAHSDLACELANDVTEVGLYGIILILIYAFLWIRQWLFYNDPAVRGLLYCSCLITFSKWCMIFITGIAAILSIFHFLPFRYRSHASMEKPGCYSTYDLRKPTDAWPIVAYIVLTSTVQLLLLGLFVYPLIRRKLDEYERRKVSALQVKNGSRPNAVSCLLENEKRFAKTSASIAVKDALDSASASPSQASFYNYHNSYLKIPIPLSATDTEVSSKQIISNHLFESKLGKRLLEKSNFNAGSSFNSAKIKEKSSIRSRKAADSYPFKVVRKVIFWCFLCILSDITTVATATAMGPAQPLLLITTLTNANILINQLCILATYRHWRQILFPMFKTTYVNSISSKSTLPHTFEPSSSD